MAGRDRSDKWSILRSGLFWVGWPALILLVGVACVVGAIWLEDRSAGLQGSVAAVAQAAAAFFTAIAAVAAFAAARRSGQASKGAQDLAARALSAIRPPTMVLTAEARHIDERIDYILVFHGDAWRAMRDVVIRWGSQAWPAPPVSTSQLVVGTIAANEQREVPMLSRTLEEARAHQSDTIAIQATMTDGVYGTSWIGQGSLPATLADLDSAWPNGRFEYVGIGPWFLDDDSLTHITKWTR